ncbi:MAG TPA: S41 family peptidase [Alkalispirochaeta sp.]|nr:S41 family peptidase [Alkalispirochaeta sp.]
MDHTQRTSRPILWGGITAVAAIFFLALALVPEVTAQGSQGNAEASDEALGLFEQVYEFIQRSYVDEVDPDTLIEGALEGMFEALDDPHSAYLDMEEMRGLTDTTSGEFGGVGMYISKPARTNGRAQYIEIVSPIEDTPAFRAGLRAGDRIIAVEGESTADMSVDDVVERLRGEPGTEVAVTILRGEELEFPVALERAVIQVPTVKSAMIDDTTAFLRIIQFTPYTDARVQETIDEFQAAGYQSLIIDLRSNPGGLLSGVVDVAHSFFDGGLVVETRGRVARENERYTARSGKEVDDDIEIVVLIDGGSASAAEILAAALKDRDRATLIGRTSYGKGSVQQVRRIGEAGFRLTMARYYTPAGTNIDQVGVEPDIVVEAEELSDAEQEAIIEIQEDRRIPEFVERVGEPSDRELNEFISGLEDEEFEVNERYLRRLVRVEVNRTLNRDEVYDLEYDRILQRAMEFLEQQGQ